MTSTTHPTVPARRWLTAVAAAALALGVSACGEDAPTNTPGAEVQGGALGPDAPVTDDLTLLQVQLAYPVDGVYEVGDDARLFFGIANTGTTAATLTDVRGPDFADATTAQGGDDLGITVAANDNVYVGAEGMPAIVLTELQTELHSAESIPVTFTFADAGEVTVDAMVSADRQDPLPTYDFPDPAEDPSPEDG